MFAISTLLTTIMGEVPNSEIIRTTIMVLNKKEASVAPDVTRIDNLPAVLNLVGCKT
jgi:hypothetical protein